MQLSRTVIRQLRPASSSRIVLRSFSSSRSTFSEAPYRRGPCQPEDCPYRREHLFPELIGGFRTCYCPEGAPIPFSNRSFWPLISPFCHRRNSTLPKSPFLLPLLLPPPLPPHHHPKPLPKRSPRRRQFSPSSSRNSMRPLRRRSSGRLRLSCPI